MTLKPWQDRLVTAVLGAACIAALGYLVVFGERSREACRARCAPRLFNNDYACECASPDGTRWEKR